MQADRGLTAGEYVLWHGRPTRHPSFDRGDWLLVPVSICWLVTVLLLEVRFFRVWPFAGVVLVPFVLIGLYLTFGRVITRALRSRSTSYVVTNHRVIERIGRPIARTRWVYLRRVSPPVVRTRDGEAVGSIAFGQFPRGPESVREWAQVRAEWSAVWETVYPLPLVLRDIEQADQVRDLIAATQANPDLSHTTLPVRPLDYPPDAPADRRDTNFFAVLALIGGSVPLCSGVFGIVFGVIALFQIRKSGQKGKGLAIAGMCVGTAWMLGNLAWIVWKASQSLS